MKTKILDTPAISMTHTNLKQGDKLQETGPVTGTFCPDTFGDKGSIGLLDESVKAAQTQHSVDYILNASFWREGNCISVEGTGAKIASLNNTPASPSSGTGKTRKKNTAR
ncbi:MAG: hypothetical protein AB7G93_08845 [Bdellovibrionales bacterium]